MSATGRRTLLTVVLFAGVLSIGPFISPTPDVDIVGATELQRGGGTTVDSYSATPVDIVGGQLEDATGIPEPARSGHRLLSIALVTVVLGIALAAVARPVERGPVRLRRPGVGLLPDRRGPPLSTV